MLTRCLPRGQRPLVPAGVRVRPAEGSPGCPPGDGRHEPQRLRPASPPGGCDGGELPVRSELSPVFPRRHLARVMVSGRKRCASVSRPHCLPQRRVRCRRNRERIQRLSADCPRAVRALLGPDRGHRGCRRSEILGRAWSDRGVPPRVSRVPRAGTGAQMDPNSGSVRAPAEQSPFRVQGGRRFPRAGGGGSSGCTPSTVSPARGA